MTFSLAYKIPTPVGQPGIIRSRYGRGSGKGRTIFGLLLTTLSFISAKGADSMD